MELTSRVDNDNKDEKLKKNKAIMFFIIAMMVVLAILAVFIYLYIGKLKTDMFKLTIDKVRSKAFVEDTDVIIDENDNVYLSVEKMCQTFGYTLNIDTSYFLNEKSVDSFYIEGPNESVNFFYFDENREDYKSYTDIAIEGLKENATKFQKVIRNNSAEGKIISNTQRTDTDDKAQTFTLIKPIERVNGDYYLSLEDAKVAFNLYMDYKKSNNSLTIYTLDYLVNLYAKEVENSALLDEGMFFCNKKALLYGYIITKAEVDGETRYGVTNLETKKTVIPNTRARVEFVEGDKEFIVITSKITAEEYPKVAIYSIDGTEIISPDYVEVTKIDNERNLYLVKDIGADKISRYGIVDKNNNIVVDVKYKKIGVNPNDFAFQSIDNPYILFDSVIPAVRFSEGKTDDWVFLDLQNQEVISSDNITQVGCTSTKTSNSGGALLFEEKGYKYIVVGRQYDQMEANGKIKQIEAYTLINLNGEILEGNPVKSFYVRYNDRGVYYEPLTDEQQNKEVKMAIVLINDKLLVDRNNQKAVENNEQDQNNENNEENQNVEEQQEEQQEQQEQEQQEQQEQYTESNESPAATNEDVESSNVEPGENTSDIEIVIEE